MQELGNAFQDLGIVMGAFAQATVGLDESKVKTIKAKTEAGTPLDASEKAFAREVGERLTTALAGIEGQLGEVGKKMSAQLLQAIRQAAA